MRLPHLRQAFVYCVMILSFVTTASAAELFVADRATNRVLSFDEETGNFIRVVTNTGLDEPSGLTFGPGGYLYVTNLQSGFPGAGASVVKVDPVTGTTTPFVENIIGTGGIAYHAASDTLFVSEFGNFDGDEVFRYNGSGTLLQTLGTGSATTGRAGMTFDSAGNLYVSEVNFTLQSAAPASVLKFDAPQGNPLDNFSATSSTFASGASATLSFPSLASGFNGLAFDGNGDLFVASLVGQSLIKFDVEEGVVVSGNSFGAPLPYPSGVMMGADGNILVTSLGNNNPDDQIFGEFLFPGYVTRFNPVFTSNTQFLIGDLNYDTVVDEGDLGYWQTKYGEAYDFMTFPSLAAVNGDLDGDFDTDGRDFLLWQRMYGNAGVSGSFLPVGMARYEPPLAMASVPEPATAMFCVVSLMWTWFRRLGRE
jgi:hypothetical protein